MLHSCQSALTVAITYVHMVTPSWCIRQGRDQGNRPHVCGLWCWFVPM